MSRQRLTQRQDKTAALNKTADPNSLGRPDRENPPVEKYMNYEFTTNHPYPDLRHQWKEDKRTTTGHPAPLDYSKEAAAKEAAAKEAAAKEASAKEAAAKETPKVAAEAMKKKAALAIKVAETLFPAATEETQIAQAAHYMEMSEGALNDMLGALKSAKTETKIAAKKVAEDVKEDVKLEDLGVEEPAAPAEAPKADDEKVDEDAYESVKAILAGLEGDAALATKEKLLQEVASELGYEVAKAGEKEEMPELEATEEVKEEVPAEEAAEDEELLDGGLGVNFTPSADSEALPIDETPAYSQEDEELLSTLFNDKHTSVQKMASQEGQSKTASAKSGPAPKKGAKTLGGVRKKASTGDEVKNLQSLWRQDPSVSHAFN